MLSNVDLWVLALTPYLTNAEIGEALGMARGTVRWHLQQCNHWLRVPRSVQYEERRVKAIELALEHGLFDRAYLEEVKKQLERGVVTVSYWVYLVDEAGESVSVKRHAEGGTYAVGGVECAELNVTYNYASNYAAHGFSIRDLDGKRAGLVIAVMEEVIAALGVERYTGTFYQVKFNIAHDQWQHWRDKLKGVDLDASENRDLFLEALDAGAVYDGGGYWKPTDGNAGYALSILLEWARQHPTATFRVS